MKRVIASLCILLFTLAAVYANPDVNSDGAVDILDLVVIVNNFGTNNAQYDINSDGNIDLLDLVLVVNNFEPAPSTFCPADIKYCSDGSTVTRDPNNNCQFHPCPSPAAVCGQNGCEASESCSSCPQDCGTCPSGRVFWGDFSTAQNDAELWTMIASNNKGNIHADPGVGMVYEFHPPTDACRQQSLTAFTGINPGLKEFWLKYKTKFSPHWTNDHPGCPGSNLDYKTILFDVRNSPLGGRLDFKLGVQGDKIFLSSHGWASKDNVPVNVVRTNSKPITAQDLWDGQWHTIEIHYKFNPNDEVLVQMRIDGIETHNYLTGFSAPGAYQGEMYRVRLGANRNEGVDQLMKVWWDDVEIWASDPGWAPFGTPDYYP